MSTPLPMFAIPPNIRRLDKILTVSMHLVCTVCTFAAVLRCTVRWSWTAVATHSSTQNTSLAWWTETSRRCSLTRGVFWWEFKNRAISNRTQYSPNFPRTSMFVNMIFLQIFCSEADLGMFTEQLLYKTAQNMSRCCFVKYCQLCTIVINVYHTKLEFIKRRACFKLHPQ